MNFYRKIQDLKVKIVDTERMLELVKDHAFMSIGLKEKLKNLKDELSNYPKEIFETKVNLLFSGNAVYGSTGIKSSFISKIMIPFQGLLKTQVALVKYGNVGKRGVTKKKARTELFLTGLPTGSFGIELSQIDFDDNDLYDILDTSEAIKQVMTLVVNTTLDDETFEKTIEKTPKRNLKNLKKFLEEIAEENSILKMESGDFAIEISKEEIQHAAQRVTSTIDEENEVFINAIFRGLLLDSGRFEILDNEGKTISGFINEDLDEETLINYDKLFLNSECTVHLKIHTTKFVTGNSKIDYELIEILKV